MTTSHRVRRLAAALCVAAVCLAAAGCARARRAAMVRNQVSGWTGCPADAVRAQHLGGPQWRAEGCGMRPAEYLCWSRRGVGFSCTPTRPAPMVATRAAAPAPASAQSAPSTAGRPAQPAAREWSPQLADRLFGTIGDRVRACISPSARLALTVQLGLDGRVAHIAGMESLPDQQQICVMSALSRVRVRGGLTRVGSATYEFR